MALYRILSTYARLFLEKLDRPDVDSIENIRPAIALEQKNPVRGSRSTVGTLTELYELFRMLFAKIATLSAPGAAKKYANGTRRRLSLNFLKSIQAARR
jgi:excinuclease ABC subunit A